jgi:hypothetical protein
MLIPELDQASTRGAASVVSADPSDPTHVGEDTRQHRVISRTLVRGLAPPEHGGVLNLPAAFLNIPGAVALCDELRAKVAKGRARLGLPDLRTFYVDAAGAITAYVDSDGNTVPASGPSAG